MNIKKLLIVQIYLSTFLCIGVFLQRVPVLAQSGETSTDYVSTFYDKTLEKIELYKKTKQQLQSEREKCSSVECTEYNLIYINLARQMLLYKLDAFSDYALGVSQEILEQEQDDYSREEKNLLNYVISNLENSLVYFRQQLLGFSSLQDLRESELLLNKQLEGGLASVRILSGKQQIKYLNQLYADLINKKSYLEAQAALAKESGVNTSVVEKHLGIASKHLDIASFNLIQSQEDYKNISQVVYVADATRKFEYVMNTAFENLSRTNKDLAAANLILLRLYKVKPWKTHE